MDTHRTTNVTGRYDIEKLVGVSLVIKLCDKLNNTSVILFLKSKDKQISKNFRDAYIGTRPAASNGLWCCVLIPAILCSYSYIYKVSDLYFLMTFISVGLLGHSILFILFMYISCLALRESLHAGYIASSFVAAIPIYGYLNLDLYRAVFVPLIAVFIYRLTLNAALVRCPKTFTIGEAMVVAQSISLFVTLIIIKISFNYGYKAIIATDHESFFIQTYIITVLSTVGLIVTALYRLKPEQRNLKILSGIIACAVVYTLIVLFAFLGPHCISEFINLIYLSTLRLKLFYSWLALLLSAVVVLVNRTGQQHKADTATRKSFHILASLVFILGICHDIQFMTLAAGLMLSVIIFFEALRKSKIDPISSALQKSYDIYCDEKDSGMFAMTAIYLYLGLACPLILVPQEVRHRELELLSGVLSTGIGDTAASWFGQRYGTNVWTWAKTQRTVEGTIFNIVSQILTVYMLNLFGFLHVPFSLVRASVVAVVSALVEARTNQVDNMVLPLVSLLAFQLTSYLAL